MAAITIFVIGYQRYQRLARQQEDRDGTDMSPMKDADRASSSFKEHDRQLARDQGRWLHRLFLDEAGRQGRLRSRSLT